MMIFFSLFQQVKIPWANMEWNEIRHDLLVESNKLPVNFDLIPLPFSRIIKDGFSLNQMKRMSFEEVKANLENLQTVRLANVNHKGGGGVISIGCWRLMVSFSIYNNKTDFELFKAGVEGKSQPVVFETGRNDGNSGADNDHYGAVSSATHNNGNSSNDRCCCY
jgi:hypothetical protein